MNEDISSIDFNSGDIKELGELSKEELGRGYTLLRNGRVYNIFGPLPVYNEWGVEYYELFTGDGTSYKVTVRVLMKKYFGKDMNKVKMEEVDESGSSIPF